MENQEPNIEEKDIYQLEDEQSEQDDFNETPPSDIVAYNELRSCADLFRLYQEGQLEIQPDFQREVVWSPAMQTRFIDSLVKQLPIPSMCISLDYKTQERLVIDGLQRMSSIINLLDTDKEWKLSKLEDIDGRIGGKTNSLIKSKYSDLFNKVQNTVIPVTVLRCDYSKKNHMHYLFTIFHRLNTGGAKLSNQEIRNCIFNGSLNSFIKSAVKYGNYINLLNIDTTKSHRFAYEELVLRCLCMFKSFDNYKGRQAKFLNDFMDENKNASPETISNYQQVFQRTIDLLYIRILENTQLPKLSKATFEGLFVGISRNINNLESKSNEDLIKLYQDLRADNNYSVESLKEGLSQREKVINRLNRAVEIFKG